MVFKRILEALARLEAGQRTILTELKQVKKQADAPEEPTQEERLQQGIDNLMAFDGRPRKRGT